MDKTLKNAFFRLFGAVVTIVLFFACVCGVAAVKGIFDTKDDKSIIENSSNDNTNASRQTLAPSNLKKNTTKNNKVAEVKTSRGGVVIEVTSKRVLADENMHARCFPASTTKVLTALIVVENTPMDKKIKIPKAAVGVEGSSIYLKENEILTAGDLLLGLMLRSGNDAAVALAIDTAGSVEAFAEMMNVRAKKCGATGSNFVTPNGLHDENHYSTPYDMALITAEAYKNADFRRIVNTRSAKIGEGDSIRYIANKNKLLTMFGGANGVKTGYTKKSGRCLVGGAYRDGMQLISVVFNYNDMWNDTMRLLNGAFNGYYMCPLENALLSGSDNAKTIEIDGKMNPDGTFAPHAYPLKRDGSERLTVK